MREGFALFQNGRRKKKNNRKREHGPNFQIGNLAQPTIFPGKRPSAREKVRGARIILQAPKAGGRAAFSVQVSRVQKSSDPASGIGYSESPKSFW